MKTIHKIFAIFFLTGIVSLSLHSQTMSVSQLALNFNSVPIGQQMVQQITISNPSSSSGGLIVTMPSLQAPYSVTPSGQHTIPIGSSKTYQVTFSPTSAGTYNKPLSITNNSANLQNPYTINLSGIGTGTSGTTSKITMSVNVPSLNFGSVTSGQTSTLSFTISNPSSSTGPLSITMPVLEAPFSVLPAGLISIAAGSSQSYQVTFTPTAVSNFNQTCSIINNSTNLPKPYPVNLSGIGLVNSTNSGITTTSGITMTISQTIFDFGDLTIGQLKTQSFTISNSATSTGPLELTLPELTSPFNISISGSISIPIGQSKTFTVSFIPKTVNAYNKKYEIINNSANLLHPNSISLIGKGVNSGIDMSVSSTKWDFGNVDVGKSAAHDFVITNLSTSLYPINLKVASLSSPFYILTSGPDYTIPIGKSQTITVMFKPTNAANYNKTWNITNNSSNLPNPYPIDLSGIGINNNINMSFSWLIWDFGNVAVGQSATHDIVVTNSLTSGAPLIISWDSLPESFSVSPSSGSIAVGSSATYTITFTPTFVNQFNKAWNIINNSTNSSHPQVILMKGKGIKP